MEQPKEQPGMLNLWSGHQLRRSLSHIPELPPRSRDTR